MRLLRTGLFITAKRKVLQYARQRPDLLRTDSTTITTIRLAKLNEVWSDAWRNVRYYTWIKQTNKLPDEFRSLEEFADKMPLLTKHEIREHRDLFVRTGQPPSDGSVCSGGSTGEPLAINFWRKDCHLPGSNYIIGRGWYGVLPGDRLFMIWGHRHLLGQGLQRVFSIVQRKLQDTMLSYYRANAYHMTDIDIERILQSYQKLQPDYVIGYASVLKLLARSMKSMTGPPPKVVIPCSEMLEEYDCKAIADAFGAPVSMEYGSAECGLIAQVYPEGDYRVFWDTHLVEAVEPEAMETPLVVSILCPAYTPLLRYKMNDIAVVNEPGDRFPTRFKHVLGRCHDIIGLKNGVKLHPSIIEHALREVPSVMQFQLVRQKGELVAIRLRLDRPLTQDVEHLIRANAARVSDELARLPLTPVSDMPKTRAGKVKWFVDE